MCTYEVYIIMFYSSPCPALYIYFYRIYIQLRRGTWLAQQFRSPGVRPANRDGYDTDACQICNFSQVFSAQEMNKLSKQKYQFSVTLNHSQFLESACVQSFLDNKLRYKGHATIIAGWGMATRTVVPFTLMCNSSSSEKDAHY